MLSFLLFNGENMSPLASCTASMALLLVSASATAQILIDDFTQTSDPSLYADSASIVFTAFDPIGGVNGDGFTRLVNALNFAGEANISLDTAAGSLTFGSSESFQSPNFILSYVLSSDQSINSGLSLDVSDQTVLRLQYQTNAPVSVEIRLAGGQTGLDLTQGNTAFVDLVPGEEFVNISLASITGEAAGRFAATPGTLNGSGPLLDDFDPTDFDRLSLAFEDAILSNPNPNPTTPGLVVTLNSIAFVPEPTTASFIALATGAMFVRRRR